MLGFVNCGIQYSAPISVLFQKYKRGSTQTTIPRRLCNSGSSRIPCEHILQPFSLRLLLRVPSFRDRLQYGARAGRGRSRCSRPSRQYSSCLCSAHVSSDVGISLQRKLTSVHKAGATYSTAQRPTLLYPRCGGMESESSGETAYNQQSRKEWRTFPANPR